MCEQMAQSTWGDPVAEKLKREAVESGALTAQGQRGSGQSQSKSITGMQTTPGVESKISQGHPRELYNIGLGNITPEILWLI